ncbi:MAG: pilus assembly protein TadG-related protein [Acidimicrobiia bacterium]|nr:pilus assembly protein TadG-related protein [Acidimicrobiia bacterium]
MTGERGTVSLLVAALLVVGLMLALLLVDVGRISRERTRLTAAADGAALAAAPLTFAAFGGRGDPVSAAAEIAAANGVLLADCRCAADRSWSTRHVVVTVVSTVELIILGDRRLQASAAAEFRPAALGAGSSYSSGVSKPSSRSR